MSKGFPMRSRTTAQARELKGAIVAFFGQSQKSTVEGLGRFSEADWRSALWWLDISGMAIYCLDRACQLQMVERLIPPSIAESLKQRLERNRVRIDALHHEARTLAAWFEGGGVPYALLKGMTLVPESVADCALRCQTDLDFLVPRRSAYHAVHYVRRLGYRLYAKSGDTLEFRAGQAGPPDLANMYSVHSQRALELHLICDGPGESNLLRRRVARMFHGTSIETLSPADILVQQALHLLKHLCGEHTRLSWVLEFHRHVQARTDYPEFWSTAQSIASEEWNGDLAMGMALWAAEEMFGKANLQIPQQWRPEVLPARIRLWMERYARELFMSDSIGSKLYGLLRNEVPGHPEDIRKQKILKLIFPLYLPARVMEPKPHERLTERLSRYAVELDYFFRRLSFHILEGIRFGAEAMRWKWAAIRCRQ